MKWEMKPLESLCDEITVGFVGTMAAHYAVEGVIFLRSQNIEPFKLNLEPSQLKFITPEFHLKIQKSALKRGDIAIVRTGYPGTACVIPNDLGEANCADLVIARPKKDVDNKFVCYCINSPYTKSIIGGSLVGSAQKHFNVGVAKRLEIPLPPLPTQQKIAAILSAYDDLIENNLKRIRLLEEAAQHLYREWFVRFRFPGWEEVPVVDGLPEGWEIRKAEDIFNINIGKTPPRNESEWFGNGKSEIKWVSIRDMNFSTVFVFETSESITSEGVNKFNMNVAPKSTVILSFKLTIGAVSIVIEDMVTNEAIAHFNILNDEKMNTFFTYCYLKNFNFESLGSTSSIGKAINSKVVKSMPFLAPDAKIVNLFAKIADKFFAQIKNLISQNQKLKEARDILLPRLMNQTIEV